jgi:hypothetical protein
MPDTLEYPTPSASLPDATFIWLDATGNPIDFSSGWTFQMKIGQPPNSATVFKTNGIYGFAGGDGSANLVVQWDSGELSNLASGRYYFQITATKINTGAQRILTGSMRFDFNSL